VCFGHRSGFLKKNVESSGFGGERRGDPPKRRPQEGPALRKRKGGIEVRGTQQVVQRNRDLLR